MKKQVETVYKTRINFLFVKNSLFNINIYP